MALIFILLVAAIGFASDNILNPSQGIMYLRDASGRVLPSHVDFTTDGNGHVMPISGGTSGPITVNQGTPGSTPWPVTVTNFPSPSPYPTPIAHASVTVDGTVNVVGAPTPIPGPTSVNVLNFPATQDVNVTNASIAITGAPTPIPAPTSVNVLNFPAMPTPIPHASVTVDGTVTANAGTGFPTPIPHASVTVDGSVAITNFSPYPTPIPHASVTVDGTVAVTGAPTPIPHASVSVDIYTNGLVANLSIGNTATISATPPPHAVGFIVESESGNMNNIRWACGGTTATTSVGFLLEPGRDSGFVPSACTVSLEAVAGAANAAVIQWVMSQ